MSPRGRTGLVLVWLGLVSAAVPAARSSPVGLTHIQVQGVARDVVLVDPLGRVDRSERRADERPIPDCNRWDGGTQTSLDDSLEDVPTSDPTVTAIDLDHPVVGRYRLSMDVTGEWASVDVTLMESEPANDSCPDLESEIRNRHGRFVWFIDFATADSSGTKCQVLMSKPMRSKR